MKNKIIIGLTGGFGVGKSSVAQYFKDFGAEVIDADEIAHSAMKKGSPVFDVIIELFEEALHPGGKKMDRAAIAEIVFSDPKKRKELEAVIHPYVYKKIQERLEASERPVILVEVPLLFEAGFEKLCNKVVVVTCSPAIKMKRLKGKRFTEQEIRARERAQMPEALKARKGNFIIDNSKSIYQTKREVERLWYKFVSLSKGADRS